MAQEFKLTQRHVERYSSAIKIDNIGNFRYSIDYDQKEGYWSFSGARSKSRMLELVIHRGRGREEVFRSWISSFDDKLIVSSPDFLCAGPLEPPAIHYDFVHLLKEKRLPLSASACLFLKQGIEGYFSKLREGCGIEQQIIQYKKLLKKQRAEQK